MIPSSAFGGPAMKKPMDGELAPLMVQMVPGSEACQI